MYRYCIHVKLALFFIGCRPRPRQRAGYVERAEPRPEARKVRGASTRTAGRTDSGAVNIKKNPAKSQTRGILADQGEPKKPPTKCSSSHGEISEERGVASTLLQLNRSKIAASNITLWAPILRSKGGEEERRFEIDATNQPGIPQLAFSNALSGPGTATVLLGSVPTRSPIPSLLSIWNW